MLKGHSQVSSKPPLLQSEQPQLFIGELFHSMDHFLWPSLDTRQQVHFSPVLRTPHLDTVLQMRSHQHRTEGQDHLHLPAGHAAFNAAQDTVGFLGCKDTLLAHVQLPIHQKVSISRSMLNPFIPRLVLIAGVTTTQVHFAVGFVEPHEVHLGLLL